MVPNLNKWKFTKLHRKKRARNLEKGNKGKTMSIYDSGIILNKTRLLTVNQLDSFKKFLNKKLKGKKINRKRFAKTASPKKKKRAKQNKNKEKTVILRTNYNLGLTKKPLQVRMGKGKGNPVDWVYPFARNRVLAEFLTKAVKLKKMKKLFKNANNKLPGKIKLRVGKIKKRRKVLFGRSNNKKKLKMLCKPVL